MNIIYQSSPLAIVNGVHIKLIEADITTIDVDSLIIAVPSKGEWTSAIDGYIRDRGGNYYYEMLADRRTHDGLGELDVIPVFNTRFTHHGLFDHIVFVIDDNELSNQEVVYRGLAAAESLSSTRVAMPVFGQSLWRSSSNDEYLRSIAQETVKGLKRYLDEAAERSRRVLHTIAFVVLGHKRMHRIMESELRKLNEAPVKKQKKGFFDSLFNPGKPKNDKP